MATSSKRSLKILSISIFIMFLALALASLVQSDFGNIKVEIVRFEDSEGRSIVGKLYQPLDATTSSPKPGVLLLHGLNTDKDTQGPIGLEAAKRGMVVLSVDQAGHGDSQPGDTLYSGFSSTLGASEAYSYLKGLSITQSNNIGIVGHSMGARNMVQLAEIFPDHKAAVVQAFAPFNLTDNLLNNYLHIWPKYEESVQLPRDNFIDSNIEIIQYNLGLVGETIEGTGLETTYGDFSSGTAQRYILVDSGHFGAIWNQQGVKETVNWLAQALLEESENDIVDNEKSLTYIWKEWLTLIAFISLLISLYNLIVWIVGKYSLANESTVNKYLEHSPKRALGIAMGISILIGLLALVIPAVVFPTTRSLAFIPLFRLLLTTPFLIWFVLIALVTFVISKFVMKFQTQPIEIKTIISTLKVSGVCAVFIIIVEITSRILFEVDLRFYWPVFHLVHPSRIVPMLFTFLLLTIAMYVILGRLVFPLSEVLLVKKEHNKFRFNLVSIAIALGGLGLILIIHYLPLFLFDYKVTFVFSGNLLVFAFLTYVQFLRLLLVISFATYVYLESNNTILATTIASLLYTLMASNGIIY